MKQLLLLCFIAFAICTSYQHRQTIVRRDGVPANSGWNLVQKAHAHEKVTFTISLQQRNLDELERRFWANSDPTSPVYAQHMTREEIIKLTAPSQDVVKRVLRWINKVASTLPRENVIKIENQHDAIEVTSSVLFAETLFETEMHLFVNDRNRMATIKQMGDLSIPIEFASDITLVTGITELPPVPLKTPREKNAKRQTGNNQCNNPYTIKNLYNVPQDLYITQNTSASIYALLQNAQDGFGFQSVEVYQQALGLPVNPITCILGNGASGYVPSDDDGEANLDTEMMTGIAPNVFTCFYLMESSNGWMYEFARTIFSTPNAPPIVSISYGYFENLQCLNETSGTGIANCTSFHIHNTPAYIDATNTLFMKLGLIGHTVLAASGDGGISGGHGTDDSCTTQGPTYPASSPYITVVGATSVEASAQDDFDWKNDAKAPAICTNSAFGCTCSTSTNEQPALSTNTAQFDTGGGFSFYAPQPKYQQSAVQNYLKSGVALPASNYFNKNNRGYPDVASVGENICLLDPSSACNFEAGTSASCPLWAGLVSHLNNDRLKAGKTTLGFLNPVIYAMFDKAPQKYFNNGFSSGNNNGGCPESMGFNAQANQWTPLTGCGSPKFDQIRAYIAALP